jgi:hypothetical protein
LFQYKTSFGGHPRTDLPVSAIESVQFPKFVMELFLTDTGKSKLQYGSFSTFYTQHVKEEEDQLSKKSHLS